MQQLLPTLNGQVSIEFGFRYGFQLRKGLF